MCGLGVFKTNSQTFTLYMRLMGANIGRNVSVSPSTDIAEFDLITVNNGATIDEIAKVRAFEARRGACACRQCTSAKMQPCAFTPLLAQVALFPRMPLYHHTQVGESAIRM
jgi:hypothetical protein